MQRTLTVQIHRIPDCGVTVPKGDIYNKTSIPEAREHTGKISGARGSQGVLQYIIPGNDGGIAPMSPQQLQLPAQDLNKTMPVNTPAWIREGLTGPQMN